MLNQIFDIVKTQTADEIVEKAGVERSQLGGIMNVIGGVAAKEVANEMTGGGISTIMNLFSGDKNTSSADSLQERIGKNIISGLIEKLGFDAKTAATIAAIALPIVISLITKKNEETPKEDTSLFDGVLDAALGGKKGGDLLGDVLGSIKF